MTPERWRRLKAILGDALERDGGDQALFIAAACGDDGSLRADVESLLEGRTQMGRFLEPSLAGDIPDLSPDSELPLDLQQWPRYHVVGPLGSGGMATVFKAWDPRLRRFVAIKVIADGDRAVVTRFMREAETQARVEHDNVLKIFETGAIGPHHYIAMPFVDGPTLVGVRDETTLEQKIELMAKVADGLHAAHRIGLVHRDIKPGNILVEHGPDGLKPYLLEFGLAADVGAPGVTQTGVIVGTPRYMAPERLGGRNAILDRRSDIYSFGATLYEFLGGVPPFDASSGLQLLIDVAERDVRPLADILPSVPPELDAIVAACLEKDPARRYGSARAVADELRRYLDGEPVHARPAGLIRRIATRTRRHPRLAAAFGALTAAILVAAGWGVYEYWRGARQADLAQQLGQEVETIDWLFRAAQMSPLHPIDAERQQVRERMVHIEAMMQATGSIATGPGEYALGRGYLTVGDGARAIDHFERAWAAGYRTADTAMGLGLAYGDRYRAELEKAQRIDSDRARASRIAEIEHTLRDRARAYLREGRTSTIVPARYVDALIASVDGDFAREAQLAEAAARETPWLFEARLLPARDAFTAAVQCYYRHDLACALEHAVDASRHYADAERVAPSAVDPPLGRCGVDGLVLAIERETPPDGDPDADPDEPYRDADAECARAVTIDPGNAEAYGTYAEAISGWAAVIVQRWSDPGDSFDRAAALAERASELSGRTPPSLLTIAEIHMTRGWWLSRDGGDPRPDIDRAVALCDEAVTKDPRNSNVGNMKGQSLIVRSRYEAANGLDPIRTQKDAIAAFERSLRADPEAGFGLRALARIAGERAAAQSKQHVDPEPGIREVLAFVEGLPTAQSPAERATAIAQLRTQLEAIRPRASSVSARPGDK